MPDAVQFGALSVYLRQGAWSGGTALTGGTSSDPSGAGTAAAVGAVGGGAVARQDRVEISPAGQRAAGEDAVAGSPEAMKATECQTCASRKYQDGSDDPGVSFKSPTSITPGQEAQAVASHEREHVVREQSKAAQEGRKVVSQDVRIHTSICPECGRSYVAGGTTTTVTKSAGSDEKPRSEAGGRPAALNLIA